MTSPTNPPPEVLQAGHETRDVNIHAILWLAIGTAVGVGLVSVGLWLLMMLYKQAAERSEPRISPLAQEKIVPPAPRLQSRPIQDYDDYRAEEEEKLTTYAWIDKEKGIVRLPVGRAKELILERGLPTPGPAKPQSEASQEEQSQEDQTSASGNEAESSSR